MTLTLLIWYQSLASDTTPSLIKLQVTLKWFARGSSPIGYVSLCQDSIVVLMFLPKSLLRDSLWAGHSYCFCDWKHMKALGLGRSKNEKAWLYCCWPWETQRSWSLPPNETGTPKLRYFDFQNGFILDSKMDHFDGPFLGSSSVGAWFLCNCRKSKLNPRKPDPVNCQRGGTFSEPAGGGTLKWVGSEVLSPPQFIGSRFSRV